MKKNCCLLHIYFKKGVDLEITARKIIILRNFCFNIFSNLTVLTLVIEVVLSLQPLYSTFTKIIFYHRDRLYQYSFGFSSENISLFMLLAGTILYYFLWHINNIVIVFLLHKACNCFKNKLCDFQSK